MTNRLHTRSGHVGGTIAALVMAPVVVLVVAGVVGGVLSLFYVVLTVLRPGIVGFFAAMTGGFLGVIAAKGACDSILKSYSHKAVFVEMALLATFGVIFEIVAEPLNWVRITPIAQCMLIAACSWSAFWKNEDVSY